MEEKSFWGKVWGNIVSMFNWAIIHTVSYFLAFVSLNMLCTRQEYDGIWKDYSPKLCVPEGYLYIAALIGPVIAVVVNNKFIKVWDEYKEYQAKD